MKNFIIGVISAVLAGVAIFITQDWYTGWKSKDKLAVEYYDYKPNINVTDKSVSRWFRDREGNLSPFYDRAVLRLIKIKNTGNAPVANQLVRIVPADRDSKDPGILSYESMIDPGGDETAVSAKLENGQLWLSYKLLDKEDEHMFWIAHDRYTEPEFVIRSPNLKVDRWNKGVDADEKADHESIDYMILAGVAFAFFLLGSGIEAVVTTRMLKKRGYDVKSLLKEVPLAERASVAS